MNDIIKYLLTMAVLALVAKLLTFIKPYKIALIKWAVKMAENKYADAFKSGKKKKAFALSVLKWCLVQTDEATSNAIDAVISIANDKSGDITSTIKAITTAEVTARLEDINNNTTK